MADISNVEHFRSQIRLVEKCSVKINEDVSSLKSELDTSAEEPQVNIKGHGEAEFEILKRNEERSLAQLYFVRCLEDAKGSEEWCEPENIDEEFESKRKELKDIKEDVSKSKKEIVEISETTEKRFEYLLEKLKTHNDIIKNIGNKKDELEKKQELVNSVRELLRKTSHPESADNIRIPQLKTKLKERLSGLQKNADHSERTTQLRKQIAALQKKILDDNTVKNQLERQVEQLKCNTANIPNQSQSTSLARLEHVSNLVEDLSGTRLLSYSDDMITVEFPPEESDMQSPSLKLMVKYSVRDGITILDDAWVSDESMDISSIKSSALCRNDARRLIIDVKSLWKKNLPLLSEITQLQHRFAIDWIQEDNLLRMMLGAGGRIVCTLEIPDLYPQPVGILLKTVEGLPKDDIDVTKLKPENEAANLTQWLQYLHRELNHR